MWLTCDRAEGEKQYTLWRKKPKWDAMDRKWRAAVATSIFCRRQFERITGIKLRADEKGIVEIKRIIFEKV